MEDIGFVHFRLATPEVIRDAITVTNVSVSSNKLCLATSLEINAILSGYYFECLKLEGNHSSYETSTISFETSTTSLGNTSLSAIVLEKLWLGKPVAKCGLPEILPFTRPDFVPLETSLGQEIDLVCMEGTTSVSGSSKLRCNKDGDWTGMYPKCEPKVTCYSLNISAYEIKYTGTVYDNRTYLIEGTLVQVTCSANDTPVVGSCHNGRWSLDVSCETAGQSMSMTNVIVIILSVTTAIALIVAALAAVSGRRKVAKLERRQGSYPSPYPEEYAVVSYDYPVDDGAYLEIQNEPNLVFKAANNEEATARRPTSYADVMIK
ncbi:hypothetical protein HDE_01788 [Halotydeus destructor]|nr:hypothetical protein HDE_01788 [Halotydeus destructor]